MYNEHVHLNITGREATGLPVRAIRSAQAVGGGKARRRLLLFLTVLELLTGVFCVLRPMPLRLAVLDENAADGIREAFPEVGTWYLCGHSLGGTMAASYLAEHSSDYAGLILLASYSTSDLSDAGLRALSIRGSEDGVPTISGETQIRQTAAAILSWLGAGAAPAERAAQRPNENGKRESECRN